MNGHGTLNSWIQSHISAECGGDSPDPNPETSKLVIADILKRLTRLEQGVGYGVMLNDSITIPCSVVSDILYTSIPLGGTLKSIAILTSSAGESAGIDKVTISIIKSSGSTKKYTISLNHVNRANLAPINIEVLPGDWLTIESTNYTPPQSSTTDTEAVEPTPSVIVNGFFILELPKELYKMVQL